MKSIVWLLILCVTADSSPQPPVCLFFTPPVPRLFWIHIIVWYGSKTKQTPLYSLIRMGLNLIFHGEFRLRNNKALLTEPHMGVMTPGVCSSVRVCSSAASSHNTQQGVLRHVMQYVCSYQADLLLADSGDRCLHSITSECGKGKQPREVPTVPKFSLNILRRFICISWPVVVILIDSTVFFRRGCVFSSVVCSVSQFLLCSTGSVSQKAKRNFFLIVNIIRFISHIHPGKKAHLKKQTVLQIRHSVEPGSNSSMLSISARDDTGDRLHTVRF